MGEKPRKYLARALFLMSVLVLMLISSFSNATHANALEVPRTGLVAQRNASEDVFGRSNITVNAFENVTLAPINNFVDLGSFSQVEPTALSLKIVNGFEPSDRFNSPYSYTFSREGASANNSLTKVDEGLRLLFNTNDNNQPSFSVYNMSFVNSVNVSRNDFLSLAISTESDFNSSEGFFGVALSLRDQQGSRKYVFIAASDFFQTDAYQLSPYFLGWSYGAEYPQYSFRYRSSAGPWFIQLALNHSFSSLDLSSARLDGLLIGGELFSIPLPYSTTRFNATLHYVLVHPQQFSINQKTVNSTEITLPPTTSLNISGISCKKLIASITGPLRPSNVREEEQENNTVKVFDVFYNVTQLLFYNFSEVSVQAVSLEGRVNITALSKTVRKCIVTINNITDVDLTENLLRSDKWIVYRFVSDIRSLRVFLVLYRFNSWIFDPASMFLRFAGTKQGIIDEYFVPERNESVVVVDPSEVELREANIAIGTGYFSSGEISVNDAKGSLNSLIVLDHVMSVAALVKFDDSVSRYTITCSFGFVPIYYSSTIQPFKVFLDASLFEIYTPFNIKVQPMVQTPLTLRISTPKTYTLKIEHDSSRLKVGSDELMVNKFISYEYFMLKPIGTGTTEFTVHFTGPSVQDSSVSIPFLVSIEYSLFNQTISYAVFIVTVVSVAYVIVGKNIADWLSHRNEGKKALQ